MSITLAQARSIIASSLAPGQQQLTKPLSVAVLDAGGHLTAFESEDGSANMRFQIAYGKAHGPLALGMGSRGLMLRAEQQPYLVQAATAAIDGALIPVPGGVLIRDQEDVILGAVGVSGDTPDNDEAAAIKGIQAIGLRPDQG